MEDQLDTLWKRAREGDGEATRVLLDRLHQAGPQRQALVEKVHPLTGRVHRIGLAGPVGVGKSTILTGLSQIWHAKGATVGLVTAEPPVRELSLGDRLRLHELAQEEGTVLHALPFDLPPRERIAAAGLVADAMEAFGCDPIFLEAPGLGAQEVEFIRRSHSIVLVVAPDPVLLEPVLEGPWLTGADIVVLNHRDRDFADKAIELLRHRLAEVAEDGSSKPLVVTEAFKGEGLEELAMALIQHGESLRSGDGYELRRRSGLRAQLRLLTESRLLGNLWEDEELARGLDRAAAEVADRKTDPESAAASLARRIRGDC